MAGAGDVVTVEFGVANVVKDIKGEGTEASSALFLGFQVGADFRSPVNEVFAYGANVAVALVSSGLPQVNWAKPEGGDNRGGREFAR